MTNEFMYGFEKEASTYSDNVEKVKDMFRTREVKPQYGLAGLVGAGLGGTIGATTAKRGNRKSRAAIGAGLGALAGVGLEHAGYKAVQKGMAERNIGQTLLNKLVPGRSYQKAMQDAALSTPARLQTGFIGAALGGGLGALGHKIVGGKEENRGKAGAIGAALGGTAGFLANNPLVRRAIASGARF